MANISEIVTQAINKWDAEGLLRMGAPSDEYKNEIETITKFIQRNKTVNTELLSLYINDVFAKTFSDNYIVYDENVSSVAGEILEKVNSNQELAVEYFNSINESMDLESRLTDKILSILNIDEERYTDISFDCYDSSFELHGCAAIDSPNAIKPTVEQQQQLWDLGFGRFWINEIDGHETYYNSQGEYNGHRKLKAK